MKVTRIETLIQPPQNQIEQHNKIIEEIKASIAKVVWPLDSDSFKINPTAKGNGVKPIKNGCMAHLAELGWQLEERLAMTASMRPGPLDAVKTLENQDKIALEWETGNISSSHRAINKIVLGMLFGSLKGGVLILPSRSMYRFLTDRIGNFQEIEPYFPQWRRPDIDSGFLTIIEIEHDSEDSNSPLIPKGTDGWANFQ
ncbi:TPA: hypothetical protein ACOJPN_004520 [Vibrio harveyi]|uniref:hypothetical protein n=1 Tax=Vibrio harveyi TaxID=669 RepID=UPI00390B5DFA